MVPGEPDEHDFNGMLFVTFANADLSSLFQSYWRSRKMFSSVDVKDGQGRVTRSAECRFVNAGTGSIVGANRYPNKGHANRTWARWGADVWAFWPPCRNQHVTRIDLGLPPLPENFMFGDRNVTITTRDF